MGIAKCDMDEDKRIGRWHGHPDRTRIDFRPGDVVRHFKHETVNAPDAYLYEIVCFAEHTETHEKLVIYKPLYPSNKICARPYDMFVSKVDKEKYPDIKQEYRFELVEPAEMPGERKQGKWISTQNPNWKAYWHEKCSVCGWWNTKDATPGRGKLPRDFKYCPNCGADMRENDE